MEREGPLLEVLVHRIADVPADFLDEPRAQRTANVHVQGVVFDLYRLLGLEPEDSDVALYAPAAVPVAALSVRLLLCWVLCDDWFQGAKLERQAVQGLLVDAASKLAEHTRAAQFVSDPERREEIARVALARLGYRPAGETRPQAEDRLSSLSASERARVLEAARTAEARARAVREALAKQAAQEAADKWSRE